MKNTLYLLIILAALGLGSCDRFDHAFTPAETVDFATQLFTPLQEGYNLVTANDLSPAMAFYADDYSHYGFSKADWEATLHNIIVGVENPQFEVILSETQMENETNAYANWRLIISDPASKAVLADSSFVGERLKKQDGQWLLRGNQSACNPPLAKQHIIVEYITNVGCSYCPPVEAKLHELRLMYPNQFTYITHQISGPVAINDPLYAYYNAYSAPVSIIQGKHKLASGTSDILAQYTPLVQSMINVDTPMNYSIVNTAVSGNNLTGSVILIPVDNNFPQENLVLNLAIIDRVSTATNVEGDPLTNIVIARKRINLSTTDLSQPVAFDFSANVAIPNDASLVIFAQRTPATFANDAYIYSGIELQLSTP